MVEKFTANIWDACRSKFWRAAIAFTADEWPCQKSKYGESQSHRIGASGQVGTRDMVLGYPLLCVSLRR